MIYREITTYVYILNGLYLNNILSNIYFYKFKSIVPSDVLPATLHHQPINISRQQLSNM